MDNTTIKYEVSYIQAHQRDIDERLKLYQKNGWVISGDIVLKLFNEHSSEVTYFIPVKREINNG